MSDARSVAWRDRRRTTHRAGRGPRHLSQLPALYPGHADGFAIDLHAAAEMRAAGAGLEELRFLQGRRAPAPADVEGLGCAEEECDKKAN